MAAVLDSNWLRVAGYVLAAGACAVAARREVAALHGDPPTTLWPRFWALTALLLGTMALGRVIDVGDLVAELGREQARSEGWYDVRRSFQVVAVGAVAAIWAVVVVVAVWRVPPRRRRYLPTTLAVLTLVGFAAVRMISLHHVDSVLYRRQLAGVKVGAVVELVLLGTTIATVLWSARPAAIEAAQRRAGAVSVSAS